METPIEEPKKIFECFFIVKLNPALESETKYLYPQDEHGKELKEYPKFCFPFKKSDPAAIGQRHQHFTFMLTDLEKRHKYGFCKLTEGGKVCYCFISVLPWFEIFYKFLNCMCAVHSRNDVNTLLSLLDNLHSFPVPKPKEIVTVSTSLTFCAPEESSLPSIPENRNMMEYYSAVSAKTMVEIFIALMFERRIIFTSSSLSILTGCVYAAESLLYPLTWQHIYIPILPPHIIDYCSAPIPFLVGVHSSLLASIKNAATADGVVVVNVDSNTVETPYNDSDNVPSEALSYLRSQLGKPNIAVGTRLPEAFLKTQARLIGGYRNALKFRMGESIMFDEEKFIEMHKAGTKRTFAEGLIQLQTFREFVDKRMELLNNGIGFRDAFENEVTELQRQDGESQSAMYKEWLAVTKKGGEIIYNVKKRAKSNMKSARESARQSMRDMKNAMKSAEEGSRPRPTTLKSRQSLRENIRTIRPPRPPPPHHSSPSPETSPNPIRPSRPPPPKPPRSSVRRYKVIDEELDDNEGDGGSLNGTPDGLPDLREMSLLDEINEDLKEECGNVPLLIDLSMDSESGSVSNGDLLRDAFELNYRKSTPTPSPTSEPIQPQTFTEDKDVISVLPAHRSSSIRRAERVTMRPKRPPPLRPQQNNSNVSDLLGINFNNQNTVGQAVSKWENFGDSNNVSPWPQTLVTQPSHISQTNGNVYSPVDGPLISFD